MGEGRSQIIKKITDFFYAPSMFFLVLVIVIIVGVDFWLKSDIQRRFDDGSFRMPPNSTDLLNEYAEFFNALPQTKIAFFGDSTVHGDIVPKDKNTLPFLFGQELQKHFDGSAPYVANFAVTGGSNADNYFIANRLSDTVDLIICPVNYKFYSGCYSRSIQYPVLAKGHMNSLPKDLASEILMLDNETAPRHWLQPSDDKIFHEISKIWFFQRHRDYVSGKLFSNHPNRRIRQYWAFLKQYGIREFYDHLHQARTGSFFWKDHRWTKEEIATSKRCYNVGDPFDQNINFLFLKEFAGHLKERHIPVIFYAVPINNEFIEKYQITDYAKFNSHLAQIQKALTDYGATYLDLRESLTCDYYRDTIHMSAKGNRLLAQLLVPEALKILKEKAP